MSAKSYKLEIMPNRFMSSVSRWLFKTVHKRTFIQGQDYRGRPFDAYSSGYSRYIESRFKKIGRGPNRVGKGEPLDGFKGISLKFGANKLTRRPLLVTGTVRSNFKIKRFNKNEAVVGWTGEPAQIMQHQRDQGRDAITDLTLKEKKVAERAVKREINRQLRKIRNIRVEVSV